MSFNLLNTLNEDKQYASISGSIKDNTASAEAGFISLSVADGSSTSPAFPLAGDIYFSSTTNKLMVQFGEPAGNNKLPTFIIGLI